MIMLLLICFLGLLFTIYMLYKNNKVHDFLQKVNNLCYEYNMHFVGKEDKPENAWRRWYDKLPSYNSLMYFYCLKKLSLYEFFSENEVNKLINKER